MKHPQPTVTSQSKIVHFGENWESGYSTTTSSEEGTLQRSTQACKTNAGVESKSQFGSAGLINMVSKGNPMDDVRAKKTSSKHHKKRSKSNYFARGESTSPSSQSSPYSSTSSLTQPTLQESDVINGERARKPRQFQPLTRHGVMTSTSSAVRRYKNKMTRSHENLSQQCSLEEITSSMEDVTMNASMVELRYNQGAKDSNDNAMKLEAIKHFQQSMEAVKSFNREKGVHPHGDKKTGYGSHVDYYMVGDGGENHYYDPLDISETQYGQIKKHVMITTSPSDSSGDRSPMKPSPVRGILKNSKPSPQQGNNSTSSTPTARNPPPHDKYHRSKSEENLTSLRRITPPSLQTSAMPLPPGGHKSAFVAVKPRIVNRPAVQEGPVVAVHPSVHDMVMRHGLEPQLGQTEFGFQRHGNKNIGDQALQIQVTPRNSAQISQNPSMPQYRPLRSQLPNTQAMITQQYTPEEEGSIENYQNNNNGSYLRGERVNIAMGNENVNGLHHSGARGVVYIPAQIVENGSIRTLPQGGIAIPQQALCSDAPHQNASHDNTECCHGDSNHGSSNIRKQDSPLPPAERLSNEAVRLKQFIQNSSPDELKQKLEILLRSKDPGSIHAMSKLFPSSEFTADAAHCVRCHKDFNPRDPGRCILPHPERMVAKISQDEIGADFVCGCCNVGFRLIKMDFYEESTNALLTGHCYSGMHTTDPESVDYRIDGGAAKSCEEHGCVEFYV